MQRRSAICLLLLPLALGAAEPGWPQISLTEALARAKRFAGATNSAASAAALAREDLKQARAAALPSVNAFNQFIYTEGNGTPSGVFVANDGVHIYNEQAIVHQELLSVVRRGEIRRSAAAAATAKARIDIASRGLIGTVVQNYFALVSAGRRIATAQLAVNEANTFLDITRKQEAGGEVAHADVIKAQLALQQRQRDFDEAVLTADKAKVTLAVLIFSDLGQNFTVVDDFEAAVPVPAVADGSARANAANPDLRVLRFAAAEAILGVATARYAYLPSFSFDFFYGINANQFAARTDYPTLAAGGSVNQPAYLIPRRQNLGYSAQVTLNIPVWNWGATASRVRQASLRAEQARTELQLGQRQADANLAIAYREAEGARRQLELLRESSGLAQENLRLTLLRYKAGESTALEVVDAQATVAAARQALDDGLLRYRLAKASLQTLTGIL